MRLKEAITRIDHCVIGASRIANIFGLVLIVAMMMLVVTNVIGRRFFNFPIHGAFELQQYALCVAAFLTWGYCQVLRGNIQVTFLSDYLSKRVMAIIDSILNTIALFLYATLSWQFVVLSLQLMQRGSVSGELRIHDWPFSMIGAFGIFLFVIVLVRTIAYNIADAAKRSEAGE